MLCAWDTSSTTASGGPPSPQGEGLVWAFPYIVKVWFAVIVLNGTSRRRPLPRFVCFGYRGERSIFVVGRGLAPAVCLRWAFVFRCPLRHLRCHLSHRARLSCGVSLSCKGEVCDNRFKRGVGDVAPYKFGVLFGDRGGVSGNRFKRGVEDVAPYKYWRSFRRYGWSLRLAFVTGWREGRPLPYG